MSSQLSITPTESGDYAAHGHLDGNAASVSMSLYGARVYANLGMATVGVSAEAAHELGKHLIAAAQAMQARQASEKEGSL